MFVTHGAKFDFTAVPGRSVTGVVIDASTKKPMPGVVVKSTHLAGPFQGYDPDAMIRAVTDDQGRYTLHGFPKGKGNALAAVASGQPYFQRGVPIDDEPGLAPVKVDLELHKAI